MYTKTETIAKEMSRSIQAFGASLAAGAITIAFGANKIACSPVIFLFPTIRTPAMDEKGNRATPGPRRLPVACYIRVSCLYILFPINKAVPMFRRWFRQDAV